MSDTSFGDFFAATRTNQTIQSQFRTTIRGVTDLDGHELADIFAAYGPAMLRWARTASRSDADAEDAVQDAMVALLRGPDLTSVVERTGSWLYTLVKRRCFDLLRRERGSRVRQQEEGLQELLGNDVSALEQLEHHELVLAVATAANRLEASLRFVFVKNTLDGLTFKEIAVSSGIPMGTLMARKQKAIDAIRRDLRAQGFWP